ncbi:zona pellucida sperm-binding protein 4-like [Dendropsophus ebraccatus]|uniref:zona pellucida sperm-binding protein 4-like n=1 Tax=Dendropsophus ebraccatus TaxID=150705 RepID=UPI0038316B20
MVLAVVMCQVIMEWWRLVVLVACQILEVFSDRDHGLQARMEVQCGMENMQVIVPHSLRGDLRMKVLNTEGKMEVLRNNSLCGIWVTQKYDGSVIVETSYDGCYVSQRDTYFVLTLGITEKQDGGKKVTTRKKMACAIETYHDAPAPSQCDAVLRPNRLKCADSQDSCTTSGCCYDPSDTTTSCYYGNKVTARCTPDGLFSIAISKAMTLPELDLTSVKLLQSGVAECNPIRGNDFFLLYQFPTSSCGTTSKVIGDQVVYENQLVATKTPLTWNRISISRDTTFRLLVRCSFSVGGLLPLKVDVVTLPPPPPVSSLGPLRFELRISLDSRYTDYYNAPDYPVVKVLRDSVFVEVRILQKSDPDLVLVLHQCWATPTSDPLNAIQWPILINGCPFADDDYKSELIPVASSSAVAFPSHYSRFDVKTFTFVDPNTQMPIVGQVYIHCSASACVPTTSDSCVAACSRSKRSVPVFPNESEAVLVSSEVPIVFDSSRPEVQNDGIYEVRTFQAETLINGTAIAMGIVAVVLLTLTTWTLHRQRKCRSVVITKPPVKARTVYIKTISS